MTIKTKKSGTIRKWRRWAILIAVAGLLILLGWMFFQASVIHVRRATVRLTDLPEAFDGTTILYASDLDMNGLFGAQRMIRAFEPLQALNPDILLLGGDFVSPSVFDRLNGKIANLNDAQAFFDYLSTFPAQLGKFAISGENDGSSEALAARLSASDIQVIENQCAVIQKDGAAIGIVGVGTDSAQLSKIASNLSHSQCVIAVAHSPAQFVDIRVTEAGDGGAWADLLLAGHTHGGQIMLFGKPILSLNVQEKQRLSGWSGNSLVTTGVGCEGVNLRLGTSAEIWVITLQRANEVRMEFGD